MQTVSGKRMTNMLEALHCKEGYNTESYDEYKLLHYSFVLTQAFIK